MKGEGYWVNYSVVEESDWYPNNGSENLPLIRIGSKWVSVGSAGGGLDGMDYANSSASLTGTFVGGAQYAVGAVRNQSLWSASYKTSRALSSVGVNVQTRVIKHGAKAFLANASTKVAIVGGVIAVTDVFMDGQVNASHLLNMGMVGVSAIPVFGWVAGGVYFSSDMITIGVSGQSIGQHLDNYVGGPLYDF